MRRKNPAAVGLGKRGGTANTAAQNESRARNAIAAREKLAAKRAANQAKGKI